MLAFIAIVFTVASYGQMARLFSVRFSLYLCDQSDESLSGFPCRLGRTDSTCSPASSLCQSLTCQFPSVPSALWVTLLTVIVMTINIIGIKTSANVNKIFVLMQIVFIAIVFTVASYGQMARAFPVSGSAYTYVTKAMNPFLGFLVGWAVLLDYLFSCIIAVLMFGMLECPIRAFGPMGYSVNRHRNDHQHYRHQNLRQCQ